MFASLLHYRYRLKGCNRQKDTVAKVFSDIFFEIFEEIYFLKHFQTIATVCWATEPVFILNTEIKLKDVIRCINISKKIKNITIQLYRRWQCLKRNPLLVVMTN